MTEFIWVLGKSGALPPSNTTYDLIKILGTICIPITVFFWFCFAEIKFKSKFITKPIHLILAFLPVALLAIVYLTSFKTGIIYKYLGDAVIRGPGFNLSGLVNNIYGITIIIHAIILYIKTDNKALKETYIIQIIFIIVCTLGGVVDGIFIETPVMPLVMCLAFIYLFINLQEPQIFSDALTGLNNRRSADAYMSKSLEMANEDNPLYLFMLDINGFKSINDTYGHLEGDNALCLVADTIQDISDKYRGFCARWGGDEFVIIASNKEDDFPSTLSNELNNTLKERAKENNLAYDLCLAIGHSKAINTEDKLLVIINKADIALYENK